jgi:hypothetical protein
MQFNSLIQTFSIEDEFRLFKTDIRFNKISF